ncbi:ATP-dependent DNA helicase RecQ-like [Ptychodera flava]|uniref:ATP-dependent DNA helicase RecQ-like n=1 Tax=Ptychodera flava TaxID=63121 RepID=UPI00396A7391
MENILNSIEYGLNKLSIDSLKPMQEKAITAFLEGQDVFVNLPTGYGKCLIYQIAPFCSDHLSDKIGVEGKSNLQVAIVVSPLVALMRDQVESLREKGINAIYLGECRLEDLKRELNGGDCRFIFASPESLLERKDTRQLLQTKPYRDMICGLFVDEVHCVAKWGMNSHGTKKAFRKWYGRLSELRSLLNSTVPLVALTATASFAVQRSVIEELCMKNCRIVSLSPDRNNIRYCVINKVNNDLERNFSWLIMDLMDKGVNAERV